MRFSRTGIQHIKLFENFENYKFVKLLININKMEANPDISQVEVNKELALVVPSKKILINNIEDELTKVLLENKDNYQRVKSIRIQGNSYSLQFCQAFGKILSQTKNIKDLSISDIFVSRLKEQIPKSIEYISNGLLGSNLLRLDISCNAVNPYGAEALLIYLKQAASLQVLIIYNCGLGPDGVARIAQGLKGTPSLKTLTIARNRMKDAGIKSISEHLQYVPLLEELFVYQNSLGEEGLPLLFQNLKKHSKHLKSLDVADNRIKGKATQGLVELIKENLSLRNLNLSDNLNEEESSIVVSGFQESKNRCWEKLGFNYAEFTKQDAETLLGVLRECPLKKLDIVGNEFSKSMKKAYTEAFAKGILSRFEDEDEEQVVRLFEELKL